MGNGFFNDAYLELNLMTKTLKSQLEEKITVLLIQGFAEFATEKQTRPFGADLSDITRKYQKKFLSLYEQFCLGVIGEDEYQGDDTPKIRSGDVDAGIRNQLRKEQRKKLKKEVRK